MKLSWEELRKTGFSQAERLHSADKRAQLGTGQPTINDAWP